MTDDQFVYLGNITPEVSRKSQLVREDKRTVTVRQSGLTLTSQGDGSTLRLVDQRGKGKLLSIKVVTDNPYVQLILEVDDWRNEGETAAELAYGGTGKQDYGLYALDGTPAKGYPLMYTPQGGEAFESRLRISLRNRIPKTNKLYGNIPRLEIGGGMPIPVNNGHAGGATFSAPSLANNSLDDLAQAMITPHYGKPYKANQYNAAALGANTKVGIDHPYVGLAGKPVFTPADLSFTIGAGSFDSVHTVFFGARSYTGSESSQVLYFTNNASDALVTGTTTLRVGDKLFIRDGGNIYFPGEIVDQDGHSSGTYTLPHTLASAIPTDEFGKVGNSGGQQLAYAVTVKPGLEVNPGPITTTLSGNTMNEIGTVTSQAATDPVIAIKSIEIKYRLEVSYDG